MAKLILILAFILSGCVTSIGQRIAKPIIERSITDLDKVAKIGEIVKRPEISQCAAFLSQTAKGFDDLNEIVTALEAEDTDGLLIASLLKEYFINKLKVQDGQTALANFDKNFPIQCGQINTIIQQQIVKTMLKGVLKTKGIGVD